MTDKITKLFLILALCAMMTDCAQPGIVGTFQFQVVATGGGKTHSVPMTLTVK